MDRNRFSSASLNRTVESGVERGWVLIIKNDAREEPAALNTNRLSPRRIKGIYRG